MKKQFTAKDIKALRKEYKEFLARAKETKEISLTEQEHLGFFVMVDGLFDYISKLEAKKK